VQNGHSKDLVYDGFGEIHVGEHATRNSVGTPGPVCRDNSRMRLQPRAQNIRYNAIVCNIALYPIVSNKLFIV
jgi:hypothetical protein